VGGQHPDHAAGAGHQRCGLRGPYAGVYEQRGHAIGIDDVRIVEMDDGSPVHRERPAARGR
jgi:hypothetical protein